MPFIALARHGQQMPPEWLDAAATTRWLSQNAPTAMLRHNGGFLLQLKACDPWAAVEEAGDLIGFGFRSVPHRAKDNRAATL